VQKPADLIEARGLIGGQAALLAKIEKPQALERIEDIVRLADAIMVARGDLGVEIPHEDVPGRQKELVQLCRLQGKPVIVATQMLESMVHGPTPTRAEASDVATAIYDGADAVMLSAESAAGSYPVEAVAMMNRIACRVQQDPLYFTMLDPSRLPQTLKDWSYRASTGESLGQFVGDISGVQIRKYQGVCSSFYRASGSFRLRDFRHECGVCLQFAINHQLRSSSLHGSDGLSDLVEGRMLCAAFGRKRQKGHARFRFQKSAGIRGCVKWWRKVMRARRRL